VKSPGELIAYLPDAVLSDGTLLRAVRPQEKTPANESRVSYTRVDSAGNVLNEIVGLAFDPMVTAVVNGRDVQMGIWLNGSHTLRADRAGRFLYAVDGRPAASDKDAAITVTRLDFEGKVLWSKRFPYTPKQVTKEMTSQLLGGEDDATREAFMRVFPKHVPPVELVRVGRDGTLLLQRERGNADYEWLVITPDGEVSGRVLLPANTLVLEASATHLWTVDAASKQKTITRSRMLK
jgi:hypothetical protein